MHVVTDFLDLLVSTDECLDVKTEWKTELGGLRVSAEKVKARSIDITNIDLGIQAALLGHHATFDRWCLVWQEVGLQDRET